MSEQRAGRGLRGLFGRPQPAPAAAPDGRYGFDYLPADSVYLDSACQTLRPQPVIDAMTEYYLQYNACGERVRYEWGRKVDERVEATREAVLRALDLSPRQHAVSFTLNTTYGLNLLMHQLPPRFARVVTAVSPEPIE